MALTDVDDYLQLVPTVLRSPHGFIWSSYDEQADVLYVNFRKPAVASDSELRDDDIIVRYDGDEVIGLTILHASKRRSDSPSSGPISTPPPSAG